MHKLIISLLFLLSVLIVTSCNLDINNDDDVAMVIGPLSDFDFQEGMSEGCLNFLVYKQDHEANAVISVSGMRDVLNLGSETLYFELPHDALDVEINEFESTVSQHLCDANPEGIPPILSTYRPITGNVEIIIDADSVFVDPISVHYEISVTLTGLEFDIPDSDQSEVIDDVLFDNVYVGWLPF